MKFLPLKAIYSPVNKYIYNFIGVKSTHYFEHLSKCLEYFTELLVRIKQAFENSGLCEKLFRLLDPFPCFLDSHNEGSTIHQNVHNTLENFSLKLFRYESLKYRKLNFVSCIQYLMSSCNRMCIVETIEI
jgi:hypothetical protein